MTAATLRAAAVLDLDALTVPNPRRRAPHAAPVVAAPIVADPVVSVDEAAVWAGIGLDPWNPWDPSIRYPHPDGGTVALTPGESAMALAHTGARYTQLKALLDRDLPHVAAMVVAAVMVQGSGTVRAAAARSHEVTLDALHGPAGWTGEHTAELTELWSGGTRTRQVCSDAAHRLHAFLRGLHHPRDRHTPRPGTTSPGTTTD